MDWREYKVLYVDDDDVNRVVMKHGLGPEFTLLLAESGEQALEILEREPIAVLMTDQRMPGMTGVELAARAAEVYPDVVRVLITAYSDLETTIDAINRGRVSRFIKKPWTQEELKAVLQESICSFHKAKLLKQMQEQLLTIERVATLGILASGIAHDLRQPLSSLAPAIELLREDLESLMALADKVETREIVANMASTLEYATQGVSMLRHLADTLLEHVRSKQPSKEPISLHEVVARALAITRSTVLKRAQISTDLPEEDVVIFGSANRLSQLLINLILNAAQAIEEGTPSKNRVTVRLDVQLQFAVLEVSDTGLGIPKDLQKKIFAPLFTTKGREGTGLGLAICKQVVDEHRGSIEVVSTPGRGTCFRVSLPYENLAHPTPTSSFSFLQTD